MFSEQGLKITAEANIKTVDFLDATFNLEEGTYSPFNKPNNTPEYVHRLSNHPPSVLKNIPEGVNRRLSSISSNEEIFNKATPIFQQALEKSGHSYKLKFNPPKQTKVPTRNRKRKIIWFNPPYSLAVKTNIGKEFLKLIDRCFPQGHPLRKIINRQTVKVSYSATHNIQRIISGKNAKILKINKTPGKLCNCRKDSPCPLDGKCQEKNIIYKATVTQTNRTPKTYIGNTSTEFKKRLAVHKHSFKNSEKDQTSLSRYIHEMKTQGIESTVTWEILDRGAPFSPVSEKCDLCTKEKFHILAQANPNQLNSRSEIFANCMHKKSFLLIPKPRGRKRNPG